MTSHCFWLPSTKLSYVPPGLPPELQGLDPAVLSMVAPLKRGHEKLCLLAWECLHLLESLLLGCFSENQRTML